MTVPKQNKMIWSDWVQNILIMAAVVIFTLNYTIVGVLKGGWFSPLKNLVMIGIFLLFAYRFFTVSKEERKLWFTRKFLHVPGFAWLLAYFIVRCICFAVNGFQYGIAREIFFEFVFLVAICPWTVGPRVRFDIVAWLFCGINLIVNLMNTYACHLLKVFFAEGGSDPVNGGFLGVLTHLKSYDPAGAVYNLTPLYSNPNSAGIMTGMAILLSFLLVRKNKTVILFAAYWLYSFYALYECGSRGAMISLITALIGMGFLRIFQRVAPKILITACLLVCVIAAASVYGLIEHNLKDGNANFTETEIQINSISTGRYYIWQTCCRAHQDTKLLGTGDAAIEKQIRNEQLKKDFIVNYGTDEGFIPTTFSVHNGYLAAVFITGWIGFVLFIVIMIDKICQSRSLAVKGSRCRIISGIVIFALMVSNFEALLVTSRYYTVLLMFLLLAWEQRQEDNREYAD